MSEHISTAEAVAHFFNSIEPEKARDDRPEVDRFVATIGADRPIAELTGAEVSAFLTAERQRLGEQDDLAHLEPLRAFLAYCARLSFTDDDLVPFMRLPGQRRRDISMPEFGAAYYVTIEGLAIIAGPREGQFINAASDQVIMIFEPLENGTKLNFSALGAPASGWPDAMLELCPGSRA